MTQHAFLGLVALAAATTIVQRRALGLVAPSFTVLVILDLKRSIDVDGRDWSEEALPAFWIFATWALVLWIVLAMTRLRSAPQGDRGEPAPYPDIGQIFAAISFDL